MSRRVLRCVGGPHDGESGEVSYGEYVRKFQHKLNRLPIAVSPLTMPDTVENVSVIETVYTVRKFRIGPDPTLDVYEFLAPRDMSDRDVFLFQFAK